MGIKLKAVFKCDACGKEEEGEVTVNAESETEYDSFGSREVIKVELIPVSDTWRTTTYWSVTSLYCSAQCQR